MAALFGLGWGFRASLAWLLLAACLAAPEAFAKTVSYTKSAVSGKSQKIDSYSGWKDDCSFMTIDVSVIRKPKNGSVTPKVETTRIGHAQAGSAGKCLGKRTRSLSVYYRSKAGFRGRDTFAVRMKVEGQAPVDFVYTVNVR